MAKRRLPNICIDEHLPLQVKDEFRAEGFRVVRANESSRYKGRDERDYLAEMYARNEIFVTADEEFVREVMESGFTRHAGIVWLPTQLDPAQREGFAEMAAGLVKFRVHHEDGVFTMRGQVLYPEKTGVTVFDGTTNHLVISWEGLLQGPST